MSVREEVVWLYRRIFGREPESEQVIDVHISARKTLDDIRQAFIDSEEFRTLYPQKQLHPPRRTRQDASESQTAVDAPIDLVDAMLSVLDGEGDHLAEGLEPPAPRTKEAGDLLARLGVARLFQASDEILEGRRLSLIPIVLALLHHAAHEATANGLPQQARASIERLQAHQPNDIAIRTWLASVLDNPVSYGRVIELYEPILPELLKHPESYAPYFRFLLTAALNLGRIDLVHAVAGSRPKRVAHSEAAADAAYNRAGDLVAAGVSAEELNAASDPIVGELAAAMLTLDEYGMLRKIASIESATGATVSKETTRLVLVLAKVAHSNGWSRPFRESLRLASRTLKCENFEALRELWNELELPEEGFEAFILAAASRRPPEDDCAGDVADDPAREILFAHLDLDSPDTPALDDALASFSRAPTMEAARRVWSVAYLTAHHDDVARCAPASRDRSSTASRSRAVVHAPPKRGNETPLWILMPWLKGADRILRVLAAYVGEATIVLSIGGDGAPTDLRRASALLLADDVHLLSRPVVSWGAQQGGFHNFVEVMEAFLAAAPSAAWLQTVCDRSYPLMNLQRFRQWIGNTRHLGLRFGFGPPSWKHEWPDDIVASIASRYHSALDEVFRTGLSKEFLELATKSKIYGDNDNRLYPSIFNFTDEPQLVDPHSWHRYMISSLEVDVRWMSFARLQGLVDVSTEERTTYTRRHHPMVTKWVQDVLSKYDLRVGSNWGCMSHHFVSSALSHPGLPELFSALDLGFAPEMNFFDTIGASLKLDSDFAHLHHVFAANEALDIETPPACVSADRDEFFFVRKTNPATGAGLIRFFADRIFEDDAGETLHWIVPYGSARSAEGDPRPVLDTHLLDRLAGCRVRIRDLFGRTGVSGRFMADGRVVDFDETNLASWCFEDGTLRVVYAKQEWGTKAYGKIGGSARALTLAPQELVAIFNQWSAFLEFDLEDLVSDKDVKCLACCPKFEVFLQPAQWIGAGKSDTALLAALSDAAESDFPTPTIEANGVIHEIRDSSQGLVALASLDGLPTLLSMTGFSQADGRAMLEFERAGDIEASAWDEARPGPTSFEPLEPSGVVGRWTMTTLYDNYEVDLREDHWICDEQAVVIGRWVVRPDGLQIFGLSGLVIGLADHFRLRRGKWRVSGWGWRNMKDSVTFSLTQSCESPRRP